MSGKSKKAGQRLLVLKHSRWWFRRAVPAACQPTMGRGKFYMVNLETSDLKVAQRLRDDLERDTSEVYAAIRSGKTISPTALNARERGLLYREALADAAQKNLDSPGDDQYDTAVFAAEAEADAFRSDADRMAFIDALQSKEDIRIHLAAHLATLKITERSSRERVGLVGRFADWAASQRPALTIDRVDRRQAGKYVTEVLDVMHGKTQSKHLMALRGYWSYLTARGIVILPETELPRSGWPWNGQQIRSTSTRVERGSREEVERPFTKEEVKLLIESPYPAGMTVSHESQIRDAIKIALLSGLRMDEVLTLWVEDVKEGEEGAGLIFDIQAGKTDAAPRPVPVHPELTEIVQRRLNDSAGKPKAKRAWLFDELSLERDPSDTFGKRFRRYRIAVGVHDKREGKRRSLVNFHSARRWFATAADRAGQQEAVIKDVIGHLPDKKNVTRVSYIARSSGVQRRVCIEAVALPT